MGRYINAIAARLGNQFHPDAFFAVNGQKLSFKQAKISGQCPTRDGWVGAVGALGYYYASGATARSTASEETAHGVHAPAGDVLAERPDWQAWRRLGWCGRPGPARGLRRVAISGHRKSGHFRRPETGVEFYLTAPCVGKVVWTLVRQLRGPHFSSITPASRTRAGRVRPRCPRLGRITGLRCAPCTAVPQTFK